MKEIELYAKLKANQGIDFIYFGGGTPSVLSGAQLGTLVNTIGKYFDISDDAEISIEIHPNHVSYDYISEIKQIGFNRVSVGIQSFDSATLSVLGSYHDGDTSVRATRIISEVMDNSGIDLIYRCEGQDMSTWLNDVRMFTEFDNLKHLSMYSLYLPDDSNQPVLEEEIRMAYMAECILNDSGYSHYASCATGGFDFCKQGFASKYETRHWLAPQASYIGLGAGAFGYVNNCITINHQSLRNYFEKLRNNEFPILSMTSVPEFEERHRYFVLGVKTLNVPLQNYRDLFQRNPYEDFRDEFDLLSKFGLIQVEDNYLRLTPIGRYYVDQVSEQFWSQSEASVPHPETIDLKDFERKLYPHRGSIDVFDQKEFI